jgi:hypothetical protein
MGTKTTGENWSFGREGAVGVWTVHDVEALFEHDVEQAQKHFQETAGRDGLDAAVVMFDDDTNLSREVQEHMADAWSQLGRAVDIERTAYVADGVRAMAVKSNVDIPDTELKAFNDREAAIEWAAES